MLMFPGDVGLLMPAYDDISPDFRNMNSHNKWQRFQEDWFFKGLDIKRIVPKKGVDAHLAVRHLAAIQGSFQPKHEHKRAAVAYLASRWFMDYKPAKD